MKRLHITAEGRTEEAFINNSLKPYLADFRVYADVRCVMTGHHRNKVYRGGMTNYAKAKADIVRWLREEESNDDVVFTTMFDFYALPDDFPGYGPAGFLNDPYEKVTFIEKAFAEDIQDYRFIPYIQLHEFEALLFTNPEILKGEYFDVDGVDDAIMRLSSVKDEYGNPELINGGKETAPSKRIIKEFPEYEHNKPSVGSMTAGMIGIDTLKTSCKHFGEWIERLEKI